MKFLKFDRQTLRGFLYAAGFTAFSAWLIWPIYNDPYFAFVVAVAAAAGLFGARILRSRAATWLSQVLYALVTLVVVGPLVSAPSIFTSGLAAVGQWSDAVTSIVFGWRQLVTIDPPIGTYHGLMVPAFVVFFSANFLSAQAILGNRRRHWLAILPFFAMVIFAFAFGQASVNDKTNLFGLVLDIPSSYVSGLVILIASIRFLTPTTGARVSLASNGIRDLGAIGRKTLQVANSWVLVLAALVIVALVFGANAVSTREVLRSAKPAQFTGQDLSPLSLYRQTFTDTEKLNQEVLRYESLEGGTDRIRLAVLTNFDGQVFKVVDGEGERLAFRLLPAALVSEQNDQKLTETRIQLFDRNSVWLPLVGKVSKVEFFGEQSQTLADHFYFNRSTNSGALLGEGVPEGDLTYEVRSFVSDTPIDPANITANASQVCVDAGTGEGVVPQSLCEWVELQDEDLSTAAGLEKLIKTLRARGYLTHSLDKPTAEGNWTTLLASSNYAFVSAKAGHSKGRIDQMFKDLISVQKAAKPGSPNSKLVATAGNDEQFATAAALIARAAGFDSRVVLGFRTQNVDPNSGVAACEAGICAGKNLTAWVEVSDGSSDWLAIDATPQYKNRPVPPTVPPGLEQNEADPGQDNATVVPPGQVAPSEDACENPDGCQEAEPFDWWGLILTILGYLGLSALAATLVLGPPLAVILGKRRRRRNRENAPTLAERITGAWDEYVDNLIDLGDRGLRRLPANETRPELLAKAAQVREDLRSSEQAELMVRYTDFAAFAPEEPSVALEREVWKFVDEEREAAHSSTSRYRQIRAVLSLRSIVYRASAPEANTVNYRRIGAEGSTFAAFTQVAKQGVTEGFEWLLPKVKSWSSSLVSKREKKHGRHKSE